MPSESYNIVIFFIYYNSEKRLSTVLLRQAVQYNALHWMFNGSHNSNRWWSVQVDPSPTYTGIPGPYSLTTGARQYMIQPFIARGRAPKPPYFLRFKGSRESK